jgi:hypothetical protein
MNSACYAVRAVSAMWSRKALRMLYFSYIHSFISYRIILGGNTPNSITIFRMPKKKKVLVMNKSKKMDSCRELFKTMDLLPLYSQYIFSLLTLCSRVVNLIKNLIKYPLMPGRFKFFECSTPKCTVTYILTL